MRDVHVRSVTDGILVAGVWKIRSTTDYLARWAVEHDGRHHSTYETLGGALFAIGATTLDGDPLPDLY